MLRPLVGLFISLTLLATPVLAGTPEKLRAAKARLGEIQADLDRAVAAVQEAYDAYQGTRARIEETRARITRVEGRIERISATLAERARSAYETGLAGTIHFLLGSSTIMEFSDRVEFLGAVQQNDADLVATARVNRERLARDRMALAALAAEQATTLETLRARQAEVDRKFEAIEAEVSRLTEKLRQEEAARRRRELLESLYRSSGPITSSPGPITVIPGAALQTCPVAGPHSFVDSWGAPRSGGRTHQGTDIMAPLGTPVVAAQSGTASHGSSSLGGLQAYVYADNGDYTFYAHLSSYGASGHVSAGTVIGYVGSTGNAGDINHLHFEYHPGNNGAVNPYPYLLQVC
jgi:peptidoglycan LD-endopeptidase LytH